MSRPRLRNTFRPCVEQLEDRVQPAISFSVTSGVLTITGTSGDDFVQIEQPSPPAIRVWYYTGSPASNFQSFTGVNKIVFKGFAGDDVFRFVADVPIPCEIDSGPGDDLVWGGPGNDTINAGDGSERVEGRGGNDYVFGGADSGNDHLEGGEGNDTLVGGYGSDTLSGWTGNDFLYGGPGYDLLVGWSGADRMLGDAGNDTLYGGSGPYGTITDDRNDKLWGGTGNDFLSGEAGNDYLNGGSGEDTIYGGPGIDTFRRTWKGPEHFGFNLTPNDDDEVEEDALPPVEVAGAWLWDEKTISKDSFWHVDQQGSPTCAFEGSLAAVAWWTGRFSKFGSNNYDLLRFIKYNKTADLYGVKLYINKTWKYYWVNSDWVEGIHPGGPLWTTLYLKAYLKAMGVKTTDRSGQPLVNPYQWTAPDNKWRISGFALQALTGYSTTRSTSFKAATMRKQLAAGQVLTAGTIASPSWQLIRNHLYMVKSVYQTADKRWRVVLYNPWGRDTFRNGNYAAVSGKDDGLINIAWSTFNNNFKSYTKTNNS